MKYHNEAMKDEVIRRLVSLAAEAADDTIMTRNRREVIRLLMESVAAMLPHDNAYRTIDEETTAQILEDINRCYTGAA